MSEGYGAGMQRWYRVDGGVVAGQDIERYLRGKIESKSVITNV